MQACIYEEYGAADVVKVREVEAPAVGPDDVLVRVHAASVTTADWRLRSSTFPAIFWLPGRLWLGLFRPRNPRLGLDYSGVVAAVGKNVTRFREGDRVFGATNATDRGAHAEYVAVKETSAITRAPEGLGHTEAAAIPFGGNTSLAFLRDVAKVRPGQRVLVVGASGAVGVWAVQIARHLGAVVTGVCSAKNAELVRSLGAHAVVDYASSAIGADGATYDLIFDTVGATTFAGVEHALADDGVYVPLENGLREIVQSVTTSWRSGKKVKVGVSDNTREGLEELVRLLESGAVRSVVDEIYPMHRIVDAYRHVESRHKRGAVVVQIAPAAAA